jgi:hypothetical protein
LDELIELTTESIVVRGGESNLPPAGEVFSDAMGKSLQEAAAAVAHGTIRSTTAGAIQSNGGSVVLKPELSRGGVMNNRHVDIMEGNGPTTFSNPFLNPIPKKDRIQ